MKNTFTLIMAVLFSHLTTNSAPHFSSPPTPDFAQFRTNLYIVGADKSITLMDGTLTQYDADYSNEIDGMDARKMSNPGENWGMLRENTTLIIERRRTIESNDSIFFKMWNLRIITYRIEFITSNLNKTGRTGFLEDKYLNTTSPIDLNGKTFIDFDVTNDHASRAADRFRVVFTNPISSPMPVTFTSVKAFHQNNSVNIDWKTSNENNVKQFEIERSLEGTNFRKIAEIKAFNGALNTYRWTDANPADGNNYYRILSRDIDGKIKYTNVLKMFIGKGIQSINIYPNPATGNNLNLQFENQQAGLYEIRLVNSFGQIFMTKSIQFPGGTGIENIRPPQNIPKGIYQLEIKTPEGERKVISVMF